jgi:hypothetical protein
MILQGVFIYFHFFKVKWGWVGGRESVWEKHNQTELNKRTFRELNLGTTVWKSPIWNKDNNALTGSLSTDAWIGL